MLFTTGVRRRASSAARELFLRFAPLDRIPARRVLRSLPPLPALPARSGRLRLEIVSHCWNYSHLLCWQLSSLASHPPTRLDVTVTVFYSPEDRRTVALLEQYLGVDRAGLEWNFRPLDRARLMRRAIGRNLAAKVTTADWIWFTDCDVLFHEGCLDSLAEQLQGRAEPLVYPRRDRCTPLLAPDDALLSPAKGAPQPLDIDTARFSTHEFRRAQGSYQITHGDIARRFGYCDCLPVYQQPVDRWHKTYEDRAFRWLLGTDGVAVDVDGLYRIRHVIKGRYGDNRRAGAVLRSGIRRARSWLHESWRRQTGGA